MLALDKADVIRDFRYWASRTPQYTPSASFPGPGNSLDSATFCIEDVLSLWVCVKQDVAEGRARLRLCLQRARPAGRVVGAEFSKSVAVAGSAGEDEFAVGGEFEEGALSRSLASSVL